MKCFFGMRSALFGLLFLEADQGNNATSGVASAESDPLSDGRPAPIRVNVPPVDSVSVIVAAPNVVAPAEPVVESPVVVKAKRLKAKIKAKKVPKVVKAKTKKVKVVKAKAAKVVKSGKGRPRLYTGKVEEYIAKLIGKHGQTNTRKILTEKGNGKYGRLRNKTLVPAKLTISLPTLIRITKEHKIAVKVGRPTNEAA